MFFFSWFCVFLFFVCTVSFRNRPSPVSPVSTLFPPRTFVCLCHYDLSPHPVPRQFDFFNYHAASSSISFYFGYMRDSFLILTSPCCCWSTHHHHHIVAHIYIYSIYIHTHPFSSLALLLSPLSSSHFVSLCLTVTLTVSLRRSIVLTL